MSLQSRDRAYVFFAFKIVGDFGASIAIPVVILAFLGRKGDLRFDTSPWFTIAGFVIALALSAARIRRKVKEYGEEYEKIEKMK